MSEIEGCTKPFLEPLIQTPFDVRGLSVDAQVHLAAWTTLRMMVWDAIGPQPRYFSHAERLDFRSTLTPPSRTQILIAPFTGKRHASFTIRRFRPDNPAERHAFQIADCRINRLILHVVLQRDVEALRTNTGKASRRLVSVARYIWPSTGGSVQWPPTHYLSDQTLEFFRHALTPRKD